MFSYAINGALATQKLRLNDDRKRRAECLMGNEKCYATAESDAIYCNKIEFTNAPCKCDI